MDYVITHPSKWPETKLLYQLSRSDTNEYEEVTKTLREIELMIPHWNKYKLMTQRRMPKQNKQKWVKLEKEYCDCINGLLEHCGKMVFWIRLQS